MPFEGGHARRHLVGAAESLKLRRGQAVIQVRVVTALTADDLELVRPAAFCPASSRMGRPAPEQHVPVPTPLILGHHSCLLRTLRPIAFTVGGKLAAGQGHWSRQRSPGKRAMPASVGEDEGDGLAVARPSVPLTWGLWPLGPLRGARSQ